MKLRYKTKAESQTCKALMAQNTAPSIAKKHPGYISPGKSRGMPSFCVGCKGKKEKQKYLFCKKCRANFLASRKAERDLDEMFERAIA